MFIIDSLLSCTADRDQFWNFGIDWDGPAPDEETEGTVVLPEISIDLDDEETDLEQLYTQHLRHCSANRKFRT